MPLYMDRHDVADGSASDVAAAHARDIAIADKYSVDFLSYWFDPDSGIVSCLASAHSKDRVVEVHAESHGLIPSEIIEVSEGNVLGFLGGVHEPKSASEITSPFRTIMFTDLEDSTMLLDGLGQAAYMALLSEHDWIVRRNLVTWQGREVKHTGDGFLVSFDSTSDALRCALDINEAFDDRAVSEGEATLRVRIGLDAGEPVDRDDDIFGTAVTMASRVCDVAPAGRTLVSEAVRGIGADDGFGFGEATSTELKGFSASTSLFEVLTAPPAAS
jgi:class 3 adenylate cyclase